ncbi:MAG TPA: ribosomal protein S18-alanine N-acetyltransferase [Actinomycetes bacterium]|nr:ribosomal protein S18-alanine N-acetyltransferase [Actinomycetes bacterium]
MSAATRSPAPTLRRMRWWDVEPVVELERELFADDPWSAEAFWSELAGVPATRHYVVATDAGQAPDGDVERVVGYAGLMAVPGQADVQTIAVAAAAQGRGLGARLLEELLAEAERRDEPAVLLEVRADNAAAIALYERHGFARLARRRGYYQPSGADALVMRRLRRTTTEEASR